jgi:glycosyltransferase involved in cell wall biosynthesis
MMVVTNPCVNDTRVIKEAESLAAKGCHVRVLCQSAPGVPAVELRQGVEYLRTDLRGPRPAPPVNKAREAGVAAAPEPPKALAAADGAGPAWPGAAALGEDPPAPEGPALLYGLTGGGVEAHPSGAVVPSARAPAWARQGAGSVRQVARFARRRAGRVVVSLRRVGRTAFQAARLAGRLGRRVRSAATRKVMRGRSLLRSVLARAVPPFVRAEVLSKHARAYRPDVIHAHDLGPLPAAVRAGRETGAKLVYDSHELEQHRNGNTAARRWVTWAVERRLVPQVDAVITVSDSIADFLAREYGIRRPEVVLNAPDMTDLAEVEGGIRAALRLDDDTPLGVYVGKITIGRGLEKLVMALPHCPEFHVALLGPSVPAIEQRLRDLAEGLDVTSRLHVVESVAPKAVVSFIRSADVGVIPIQDACLSYRFCMPNKLFEMSLSGLPVCVSKLPEMEAFVEREGVGVTMDETDPADIARAMREAYARRRELAAAGDRHAALAGRYSWERQAERLVEVYQRLGLCA